MMVSGKILFVFEGEKTEVNISKNFINNYFSEVVGSIVISSFCGELYQFSKLIKEAEDEFGPGTVDVFKILQERDVSLKYYKKNDFSYIYYFFDYELHSTNYSHAQVVSMINLLSDETDYGKLFISYPMIESLRYHNGNQVEFKESMINISDSKNFKQIVDQYAIYKFKNSSRWCRETWKYIITEHCKKTNYIVYGKDEFPNREIEQLDILEKQLEKIETEEKLWILNAFPLMLLDYYGSATQAILASTNQ